MPDIYDVARYAGVSPSTVSLVLNGKGNISDATRNRVLQAVQELGYTRSVHARNLRNKQSRIIGYNWDIRRTPFNPILDTFLYEMVRLTEARERHLLLFTAPIESPFANYRELVDSRRVDGFVLSNTEQNDPRFALLQEMNVPFVAFGRSMSDLDTDAHWVDVDGRAGMRLVFDHLIAQGHRRIGLIAWPQGSASGDERTRGGLDSLHAHGLPQEALLLSRGENDVTTGYVAAREFMTHPNPPTAIAAVSDIIAMGALRYLSENNLNHVAVTGYDDTPIAEFTVPTLTSVRQPIEQIASLLDTMLDALLNGQTVEKKHHLLVPQLIVRQSSAKTAP